MQMGNRGLGDEAVGAWERWPDGRGKQIPHPQTARVRDDGVVGRVRTGAEVCLRQAVLC